MSLLFRIALVTLGLSVSILMAEIYLRIEQNFFGDWIEYSFQPKWVIDSKVGRSHPPNSTVQHSFKLNETIIYDVKYNFDKFGRRVTLPPPKKTNKFIAIFGASTTFGQGLSDDETFPSQLSLLIPDTRIYNYGIHGSGPQHLVGLIPRIIDNNEIDETEGLFVYYFSNHHLKRLNLTISVATWTNDHLYLSLDTNGKIKNHGRFSESHPWRHQFFELLKVNSRLLPRLNIDYPLVTNQTYKLFTSIMTSVKTRTKNAFPKSKFFVLFNKNQNSQNKKIREHLDAHNIAYTSIQRPHDGEKFRHYKKYDTHENALGAQVLAQRFKHLILSEEFLKEN